MIDLRIPHTCCSSSTLFLLVLYQVYIPDHHQILPSKLLLRVLSIPDPHAMGRWGSITPSPQAPSYILAMWWVINVEAHAAHALSDGKHTNHQWMGHHHFCLPAQLLGGFTLSELLDKPWSQVGVVCSFSPSVRAFIFIAHRVQHSRCSTIVIECCH